MQVEQRSTGVLFGPYRAGTVRRTLLSQGYVAVPIQLPEDAAFTMRCRIGIESYTMLVDTGASMSYLDAKLAKRLGLKVGATQESLHGTGAVVVGHKVAVRNLVVGGFESSQFGGEMTLIAQDMSALDNWFQKTGRVSIGGILGHAMLSSGSAVIDYTSKTLYLRLSVRAIFRNHKLELVHGDSAQEFLLHGAAGEGRVGLLLDAPGMNPDDIRHYVLMLTRVVGGKLQLRTGPDLKLDQPKPGDFSTKTGIKGVLLEFERAKSKP